MNASIDRRSPTEHARLASFILELTALAARASGVGALLLLPIACGSEAAVPALPEAATVSLEGLGTEDVHGTLEGSAFEAVEPRFVVVRRAGRERVDLVFSDRRIERCGLPLRREDRRVWIRFADRTVLEPGAYERLDDDGAFEVHYEIPAERGPFRSAHRGIGRIEIEEAVPESISGRLHVCFADAEQSCVSGAFRARPCLSRIDGRALRESPGLVDEALERAGAAAP